MHHIHKAVMGSFDFEPMDEASARAIVGWQYESPYDIYNMLSDNPEADVLYLMNPTYHFHAITDEKGALVAFCSFGVDAQVPGGGYSQEALDIGMGVRPDLTGQGNGRLFAQAVLEFARDAFAPSLFRVTIAGFNHRAQKVWQGLGFVPGQRFEGGMGKRPFVIFTRET